MNRRNIVRGIRVFAVLTVVGIALVFYLSGSQRTFDALGSLKLGYMLVAFLLIGVDLSFGASRIHIFLRKIRPKGSFWISFKANLANIFLAAATPFQTGGGLAQLYILNQNGIPYSSGVAIGALNFVATMSLLLLAGGIILTPIGNPLSDSSLLSVVFNISRVGVFVATSLILLAIFRPSLLQRAVSALLMGIARRLPNKMEAMESIIRKFNAFAQNYREFLHHHWVHQKFTLVLNFLLTFVLYFNKCLMAYVICLGLDMDVNFWQVVLLQMLVVLFLYFAPTPGGSLLAETSTSAAMSIILPGYLLSLFAVLWRFFTTYFGVLLGGVVIFHALGRQGPNSSVSPRP
jgi:hypothetical protein